MSENANTSTYGVSISLAIVDGIVEITYLSENTDHKDEIKFNNTTNTSNN